MKDLFSKEYKRKLVLKSKLSGKNKIVAANTWAVAILVFFSMLLLRRTNMNFEFTFFLKVPMTLCFFTCFLCWIFIQKKKHKKISKA